MVPEIYFAEERKGVYQILRQIRRNRINNAKVAIVDFSRPRLSASRTNVNIFQQGNRHVLLSACDNVLNILWHYEHSFDCLMDYQLI